MFLFKDVPSSRTSRFFQDDIYHFIYEKPPTPLQDCFLDPVEKDFKKIVSDNFDNLSHQTLDDSPVFCGNFSTSDRQYTYCK